MRDTGTAIDGKMYDDIVRLDVINKLVIKSLQIAVNINAVANGNCKFKQFFKVRIYRGLSANEFYPLTLYIFQLSNDIFPLIQREDFVGIIVMHIAYITMGTTQITIFSKFKPYKIQFARSR